MPQPSYSTYDTRRDVATSGPSAQSASRAADATLRRRVVNQRDSDEAFDNTSVAVPSAPARSSQQQVQQPQVFRDGGGEKSRQRMTEKSVAEKQNPTSAGSATYASGKLPAKLASTPAVATSSSSKSRSGGPGKPATVPPEQQVSMQIPAPPALVGNKSQNPSSKNAKNAGGEGQSVSVSDRNSSSSPASQHLKSSAQTSGPVLKSSSSTSSNTISDNLRRKAEQRWADWFISCGIPVPDAEQYARIFVKHRVQKTTLCSLTKDLLYDMGITRIGDVISILRAAKDVSVPDNLAAEEHQPNRRSEEWLTDSAGTFAAPGAAPPSQVSQRSKKPPADGRREGVSTKSSNAASSDIRDVDDSSVMQQHHQQLFIPDAHLVATPSVMPVKQSAASLPLGKDLIHSVGPQQHTSSFVERTAKAAAARGATTAASNAPRIRFDETSLLANTNSTPKLMVTAKSGNVMFGGAPIHNAAPTVKKPITMQPTNNGMPSNQRNTPAGNNDSVLNVTKMQPSSSTTNRTVIGSTGPAKVRLSNDIQGSGSNPEQGRVFPNHQITVKMVPNREMETGPVQTVSMRANMQTQRTADEKPTPAAQSSNVVNNGNVNPAPSRGRRVIISDELKQQLKQQQQQQMPPQQQQLSLQLQPPAPLTTLPGGMVVGGLYSDQLMMRQYAGGPGATSYAGNTSMQYVPPANAMKQQIDMFPKQPTIQPSSYGGGLSHTQQQQQQQRQAMISGNVQQQSTAASANMPAKTAVEQQQQPAAPARRPLSERLTLPGGQPSASSVGGVHRRIGIQTASLSNRRNTDQQQKSNVAGGGVFGIGGGLRSASSLAAEQQQLSNKRKTTRSPSPPPTHRQQQSQPKGASSPTKISARPASTSRTTTNENATFADNNTILTNNTSASTKRLRSDGYGESRMSNELRAVEFEPRAAGNRKTLPSARSTNQQAEAVNSNGRGSGRRRGGSAESDDAHRRRPASGLQRSISSRLGNGGGVAKAGRADRSGGDGGIGKSLRQRLGVKARLG